MTCLCCQQIFEVLRRDGLDLAETLLEDNSTIAAMRAANFDLVIGDIGSWPTRLPAKMLGIPEVDFFGIGALMPFAGPRWSIPNPIAYIPQFTSTTPPSPVS